MPMIPPDYTALERKARFYASRRRASGGYTLAEFLEESADALALAASLQEEKAVLIADFRREESAWSAALDKSTAENQRLQEEIARLEKLKERYRLDCLYHAECRPNRWQAEAAMADAKAVNDAMADEIAKNRALQEEIERLKRYAVHQNRCAKWWYHQIEAPNGELRDNVPCSCGLAPGVEEKGEIENVTES